MSVRSKRDKSKEYEKKDTKGIFQASEKNNKNKDERWKFDQGFEHLGCGCYKILCNIYWTRLKIQEMGKRLGN